MSAFGQAISGFTVALTVSGGSYATFADYACLLVIACVLGLLLILEAFACAFGYRKCVADQPESA